MVYESGKRGLTTEGTMNNVNKTIRQAEDLVDALSHPTYPLVTMGAKGDVIAAIDTMVSLLDGQVAYLECYEAFAKKVDVMQSIKPSIVTAFRRKVTTLKVTLDALKVKATNRKR